MLVSLRRWALFSVIFLREEEGMHSERRGRACLVEVLIIVSDILVPCLRLFPQQLQISNPHYIIISHFFLKIKSIPPHPRLLFYIILFCFTPTVSHIFHFHLVLSDSILFHSVHFSFDSVILFCSSLLFYVSFFSNLIYISFHSILFFRFNKVKSCVDTRWSKLESEEKSVAH